MLRALLALLTALLLFVPRLALAQVNAESLRPNPLRAGWSGGLDASFALLRGNIELLDVGGGGRIQVQTLHPQADDDKKAGRLPFFAQRALLTANGRFAERGTTPFVSQTFVHARWTAMWHERVGSDLFAQHQYNDFLRLETRAVFGGGVRVEIVHEPVFMLWAGSGYMLEYQRLKPLAGALDPLEAIEHRWTSYLVARLALFESRWLVQNTFYVQPRFDDFADVRILEELETLAKVTEVFALGATVSVLYDSAPPTAVVPTDLRVASTVRLTF